MRRPRPIYLKPVSEAEDIFEDAVSRGEIYNPEDALDDQYAINDPATDEGPEISQKLGGTTTDDDDDDSSDGEQPPTDEPTDTDPSASSGGEGGESGSVETESGGATTSDTPAEASAQTADASADATDDTTADTEAAQSAAEQSPPEEDTSTVDADEPETTASTASTDEATAASDDTVGDQDDAGDNQDDADDDLDDAGDDQDKDTQEEVDTTPDESVSTETDGETETETGADSDPEPETVTGKTKQDYIDDGDTELQAEIKVDPPEESRVKAAMGEAIRFFHGQLDSEIPENIEWNRDNPDAPYRKPETAREYFQDPSHDSETAEAVEVNNCADLIQANIKADDGKAEYEISKVASDEISATTARNNSSSKNLADTTASNNSSSNNGDGEDTESVVLYNYRTRDNRGWSPDTIDDKLLGWAPRDTESLREHLLDEGFTTKELFATGLFNDAGDGTLLPFMQARYIIPYFDDDGKPVFLISRSIDTSMDRNRASDFHRPTKYLKPKESLLEEPIYGTQTIQEGEPLVITEGIADAITAHEHGIPCISPVTTQFKDEHYPILRDLIVSNDVPQVFIIQDADPPTTEVPERFTPEYAANYDPEEDTNKREPVEIDSLEDDAADRAITVNQSGPGFNGALKTALDLDLEARRRAAERSQSQDDTDYSEDDELPAARYRHTVEGDTSKAEVEDRETDPIHAQTGGHETWDRAFETYLIELPEFGGLKYDLDDYLSDGMLALVPPAKWVFDHYDPSTPTTRWITDLELDGEFSYSTPDRYGELPPAQICFAEDYNRDDESSADTESGDDVDGESESPIGTDGYAGRTTSSRQLPVSDTTLHYIPTLPATAVNMTTSVVPPYLDSKSSSTGEDLPSMDGGSSSDADMWDLTWRDVFGKDEGFRGKSPFGHIGDSENYFVVISPTKAYCHKRKVTYTPSTGVLVRKGERFPEDPEGSLDGWEKFVYWAYLREKAIVDDNPPNEALLAYARKHDLATDGDGIETIDGEYGEFDALTKDALYQVLDDIEANYAIDVTWDPYGDRHAESDTSGGSGSGNESSSSGTPDASTGDTSSGESASPESEVATDDGETDPAVEKLLEDDDDEGDQSPSSTDSQAGPQQSDTDPTSHESKTTQGGATDSESPAGSEHEAVEVPVDDEGDEDVDPIKKQREAKREDRGELGESENVDEGANFNEIIDNMESTDPHEKFRTYNGPMEPDEDNDDVDVDREAVLQFAEGFTNTDNSGSRELKEHKKTLYNAFNAWAKINGIELDEVSEEVWINNRVGNFGAILEDKYELTESKYTVNGERKKGFAGIELSEEGEKLLNVEI